MRKFIIACCIALFGINASAVGAVAGIYQGTDELTALITDERLLKIHSAYPIVTIQRTADGYIVITSNGCVMKVDVKNLPLPDGMAGKVPFELVFHEPICVPDTKVPTY